MELYLLTEVFRSKLNGDYTTTSNNLKDKDEALNLFELRSYMITQSSNISKIIKQIYNPEECYGFTKVELNNGDTLEIRMSKLTLV